MEQGDIIRVTDVQTLAGYTKEILNVYYFHVVTMTGEVPLALYGPQTTAEFNLRLIQPLCQIQSSQLSHVRLEMLNMTFQQEEFTHTWTTPIPGVASGDYMPGNLTYSFRLQRYTRLTRNGRKSIAGVTDAAVVDGRLVAPLYLTPIQDCSVALSSPIPIEGETADSLWSPVIVRVPANPGVVPTVFNTITSAPFRGFGTMNSRKAL